MPNAIAERPSDDEQRFEGMMRWQCANDPFWLPRLEAVLGDEIAFADIVRHESIGPLVDGYDASLERFTVDVTREILTINGLFEALLAAGGREVSHELSASDRQAIERILQIEFDETTHLHAGDLVKITGEGVVTSILDADIIKIAQALHPDNVIVGTIRGPILVCVDKVHYRCAFLLNESIVYDAKSGFRYLSQSSEVAFIPTKPDTVRVEKLLPPNTD